MTIAITRAPETIWVWQTVVPQLVQQHEFLLHSLLSLTSAHMASTSLPPAPTILVFVILNSLAALSLLPLKSLNSSSQPNSQDLDNFVAWLVSVRHAVAFAGLRSSDNQDTEIAKLVSKYRNRDLLHIQNNGGPVPPLSANEELPELLLASLDKLSVFTTTLPHLRTNDVETLRLAILRTKLWFRLVPLRPQNAMYLFLWLSSMSDDFFALVERKCTISLAIMAHWLTVVYNAPHPWFISDWPGRALKAIMLAVNAEELGAGVSWISEELF
ncbi:hypothetical protein FKW77_000079 [Venturia effusa]|uniref:Uncharacterized protein n=1 Tax=Venturia effusa TaxID=50376 RepID=A0A517LHU0_9PEZI|nr:hypothetical protein FKW77_000079 [Venturia effusa]